MLSKIIGTSVAIVSLAGLVSCNDGRRMTDPEPDGTVVEVVIPQQDEKKSVNVNSIGLQYAQEPVAQQEEPEIIEVADENVQQANQKPVEEAPAAAENE